MRIVTSLIVSLMVGAIACGGVSAESQVRSKAEFAKEFRAIEAEGIALVRRAFPGSPVFTAYIENYETSDENSLYVANFSALMNYVRYDLKPELENPSPEQSSLLREILEIADRHDKLQLEYSAIYKRLPVFD